ncbi:MAG: DUF3592 domain-containing protein [Myxococcaceae bacterium]|nr:DUF3592 domain-containing protein [Myxococcaceae bacterium]
MQLAIPKAPRKVKLAQVPGAYRRLAVVAGLGFGIFGLVSAAGLLAGRWLGDEAGFFGRAVEVEGRVSGVSLPKWEDRTRLPAKLTVLYTFDGLDRSVSGVLASAERAEGLGHGAKVTLLVDPKAPEAPREADSAREGRGLTRLAPFGVGLGLLVAVLLVALEVRRAVRAELQPLRSGMLVWLTCEGGLPDTRAETTFAAHYFQQDVKREVRARARPGRAPVKNGEKVLAAVVPSQPTWVRVIDEDLARTLGWYA